ncbi:DUF1343 domain-containing protein [Phaeocystidibacter marisrubri]|uniref:DUF1343 domain-containing protein n=2 Tax=Phaeocystidibacter marisrubri TaxID=1577780 RepID=A0A6L3ZJR8_9FLAO|nr:DUF1343 domain-containing protein [Phaeocystidibacter marisrubri]
MDTVITGPVTALPAFSERTNLLATNHSQRMNLNFDAKDIQMRTLATIVFTTIFCFLGFAQQEPTPAADIPGAWLGQVRNKTVAVVANPTSMSKDMHLVDRLVANGVTVKRVFAPEHGFRGDHAAGEHVSSDVDSKTGIPIVSLYGNHKKPTLEEVVDVDLVIFDIQDVGVRFYTYISTMTYVMEACAEAGVTFLVLDRPNPNGNFVDGPVLKSEFSSFVGLHPVPIAHGMTVGEYAKMVKGEGWIENAEKLSLLVSPCLFYEHDDTYSLPITPSPNLPNDASIALYPSLCLFEGTPVSIGRGTDEPFQWIGAPWFPDQSESFTPKSVPAAPHPKFENEVCYGVNVQSFGSNYLRSHGGIYLFWLIEAYNNYDQSEGPFFTPFFSKLAGTDELQKQIEAGMTEEQIRASWQPDLDAFRAIRSKYLLYN